MCCLFNSGQPGGMANQTHLQTTAEKNIQLDIQSNFKGIQVTSETTEGNAGAIGFLFQKGEHSELPMTSIKVDDIQKKNSLSSGQGDEVIRKRNLPNKDIGYTKKGPDAQDLVVARNNIGGADYMSYDAAGNNHKQDDNYSTYNFAGHLNKSSNSSAGPVTPISNSNAPSSREINSKTKFSSFPRTSGNGFHNLSSKNEYGLSHISTDSNNDSGTTNQSSLTSKTTTVQIKNFNNLESSYQSTTAKQETTTCLNVNCTRKENLQITIHQRKQGKGISGNQNTSSNESRGASVASNTSLQGVNNQSSVSNTSTQSLEDSLNRKFLNAANQSAVNDAGNFTMRAKESLLNSDKNNNIRLDNQSHLESKKASENGTLSTTSAPREITAIGLARSPNLTNVEMDSKKSNYEG
jgi:hypothetical protein